MKSAAHYITQLLLEPHPEGGYFKEIYRDPSVYPPHQSFDGERNYSTAIYYLLEKGDFSCFHRIKSDEIWHHYDGGCVIIHYLKDGKIISQKLGKNLEEGEQLVCVVPKDTWFAAEASTECDFALMGCTVAPGFDFHDFEMASTEDLEEYVDEFGEDISRLIR